MKYLTLITIIFLASSINAHQLYRHVGPNGEVYFTDQPSPDAVPVEYLQLMLYLRFHLTILFPILKKQKPLTLPINILIFSAPLKTKVCALMMEM